MFTEVWRFAESVVWEKAIKPIVNYCAPSLLRTHGYTRLDENVASGAIPAHIEDQAGTQRSELPWTERFWGVGSAFANSTKSVFVAITFGKELLRLTGAPFINWGIAVLSLGGANFGLGSVRSLMGKRVHHTDALLEGWEILTACLLMMRDFIGIPWVGAILATPLIFVRYYDPDQKDWKQGFRALGHRSLAATGEFAVDPHDTVSKKINRGVVRFLHLLANGLVAADGLRRDIIFFNGSKWLRFLSNVFVMPTRALGAFYTRWLELKMKGNMHLSRLSQQRSFKIGRDEAISALLELVMSQTLYVTFDLLVLATDQDDVSFTDYPLVFIFMILAAGIPSARDGVSLYNRNLGHRTAQILQRLPAMEETLATKHGNLETLQKSIHGVPSTALWDEDELNPLIARRDFHEENSQYVIFDSP